MLRRCTIFVHALQAVQKQVQKQSRILNQEPRRGRAGCTGEHHSGHGLHGEGQPVGPAPPPQQGRPAPLPVPEQARRSTVDADHVFDTLPLVYDVDVYIGPSVRPGAAVQGEEGCLRGCPGPALHPRAEVSLPPPPLHGHPPAQFMTCAE